MKEYRNFTEKELKWVRSLERIMKKAPNTLFMFVGTGINIHVKDSDNKRYMNGDSVDNTSPAISVFTEMDTDGGDY